MNLRTEGTRKVTKLKGEAVDTNPRRAKIIRRVWQEINIMVSYTPDEA
jgi:hypothetical protein